MTRRLLLTVALGLAVTAALPAARQQPQTPAFRASADVVTVNVSVRRGNLPLTGLSAADFSVADAGVPQRVARVTFEQVPIDVTLIIDVSGSTQDVVEEIRRDARRILEMLRPIDRGRVLAIDTYVHELLPLQTVSSSLALPPQPASGGDSSIYDAITAALIGRVEPDRRRLVVVFTDGGDTLSVTGADELHDVARHSDAVLHIAQVATASGVPFFVQTPVLLQVRPVSTRDATMRVAAELTGGTFHASPTAKGGAETADVVRAFRRILNEFRESYVIQYTPENVPDGGWHELTVTVRGVDAGDVRARKGYFSSSRRSD